MRNLSLKVLVALATLVWAGSGTGRELMDIKEFVRQLYIHGVPYEEASKYDASVVPTLVKMLNDSSEQAYWSNIVVTLGMIGDESAVEPMIEFIEKSKKGKLNRNQRRAKTSAVMSLGYLINKSGNQKALEYLTTTLSPEARAESPRAGASPLAATAAKRGEDLSKYAVMGLALSGSQKAAEALKSIRKSQQSGDHRAAAPMAAVRVSPSGFDVGEMLDEALRANEEIADKGLTEYYGGK